MDKDRSKGPGCRLCLGDRIWIIGWIAPGWNEIKGLINPIVQSRPSAARNSSPQTEATTFAFSFVFILILWFGVGGSSWGFSLWNKDCTELVCTETFTGQYQSSFLLTNYLGIEYHVSTGSIAVKRCSTCCSNLYSSSRLAADISVQLEPTS